MSAVPPGSHRQKSNPKNRRGCITIVLLLIVGGAVWYHRSQAPFDWAVVNSQPRGTGIIAFGDSLTAGYGAPPGQSYPDHLSDLLEKPVINAGISGDETSDALRRLERDVLFRDPRIVIVGLGGNDMLRNKPAARQFANLRQIVTRIQAEGALVIILGLEGLPLVSGADYGERYEELARETGAAYVPDILGGIMFRDSLMADSIHPNGEGYRKMAERIYEEVGHWLQV